MPADNEKKTFDNVPSGNIRRSPVMAPATVLADLEAKRRTGSSNSVPSGIMAGGTLAMSETP